MTNASLAQRQALLNAVRGIGVQLGNGDIDLVMYRAALCGIFQTHFGCARASLWRFVGPADARQLRCLGLHTAEGGFCEPEVALSAADFGVYMREVLARGVFVASDVRCDPHLHELRAYFDAHQVCSLLDTAFQINGEAFGVVCLEETGQTRHWTRQEQTALRDAASLVSLSIARLGPRGLCEFGLAPPLDERTPPDDW